MAGGASAGLLLTLLWVLSAQGSCGQALMGGGTDGLPDAPAPQSEAKQVNPCPSVNMAVVPESPTGVTNRAKGRLWGMGIFHAPNPCVPQKKNWYQRFADGPHDKPLTARDKGWLAVRNLVDPFNLITIGGEAGIAVAADSHSVYGPGFAGYGRDVGVSFTEDMTGEFFGTYAIPSVAHQDPRYHRLEGAGIPRRVAHAMLQVVWTQHDDGRGMLNYANLVGFAIDDEIANLYIPGRETNASATASRYVTTLATAPIGNFISEFVPDVASHIHVQIVVIQRIINQVARTESGGAMP